MSGGFGELSTEFMRFLNEDADTVRVLELETSGTNGATTRVFVGNRDPVGSVSANPGEFYIRVGGANSKLYQHVGTVPNNTDWGEFSSAGTSDVVLNIRNETGATLIKGTPVYASGYSIAEARPLVATADKDDPAKRPTIGIIPEDILNNSNGRALVAGTIYGLDTSMFALTDQLALGSAGALIRPPPDNASFGEGDLQNIGSVSRAHATDGEIVVALDGLESSDMRQISTFVYRPGAPVDTQNLFGDFNDLYLAFQATEGLVLIWFDDSLTSPTSIPAKSGGGAYAFEYRAAFAAPTDAGVVASCADDCEITGLLRVSGLELRSDNTTTPVITVAAGDTLIVDDAAELSLGAAVATQPVLRVPTGISATLILRHCVVQEDLINGNPVIALVGTGALTALGFPSGVLSDDTVIGGAGTTLTLVTLSTGASLSSTQTAMAGTIIPALGTDATRLRYVPTTPGDWSPAPDDVAEALDQIAAPPGTLPTTIQPDDAASVGTSNEKALADHRHAIVAAAPAATGVATASAEGVATSFARSDHAHQANTAPADVTKAAAAIGTSGEPARADHKHDASTAAPAVTGVATVSAEGVATTLARSDHAHQSNTAPVNVTKAAAAIGTSGEPARADHKHDATTATPVAVSTGANAEGTSTALARADHVHNVPVGVLATKEVFYPIGNTNGNRGDFPVQNLGSGGSGRFQFRVPHDFTTLTALVLVAIPGGTVGAADIDLSSDYGAPGEAFNANSESNTVITFALTINVLAELDITSVFSALAANDYAGLLINHTGVTGGVDYLGIRLRYT